ncbi:MAG: hypothetical protein EON87_18440, partial [Brevundimonas sp.]
RPGAEPVAEADEIARTVPVIAAIRAQWLGPISIDTLKPGVREAVGRDVDDAHNLDPSAHPFALPISPASACR